MCLYTYVHCCTGMYTDTCVLLNSMAYIATCVIMSTRDVHIDCSTVNHDIELDVPD